MRTSLSLADATYLSPCLSIVIQNVPDDLDSRLALAEIYERLDMREEALELVNEGPCAACIMEAMQIS